MACDCMTMIDAQLATHNSRIVVTFNFSSSESWMAPRIATEKINPRNRDKMGVIAKFCPFCGVKYLSENGGKV